MGATAEERQVEELRAIKGRIAAEYTMRDVPADSPWLTGHVAWLDEMAGELLETPGGWWTEFKDVNHPFISHNGKAFYRAVHLILAYKTPASRYYRDEKALDAARQGLRHLLQFAHPESPERPPGNWWAWDIGIPTHLLTLLIVGEDVLEPEIYAKEVATATHLLKAEKEAKLDGPASAGWADGKPVDELGGKTDMNDLWHHQLRLRLAVVRENPAMAGKWSRLTFAEIGRPGQANAWQRDFSYKFHGKCPMWAYGRAFVMDYPRLIARYQGTAFGPTAGQLDSYAAMLEHYVQGFLYRNRICPAIIGREISRGEQIHHNAFILAPLAIMAESEHPKAALFAGLLAREKQFVEPAGPRPAYGLGYELAAPNAEPAPPVNDTFAYPDVDFLQITRPTWAMGIKMHSVRNCGYESINRENMRGWFLSHGSTFHYLDGDEWDAAWSTIDWTRLPGTTVVPDITKGNHSPFAGVIRASTNVGLAAMELRVEGFTARKSWLAADDVVVCQGSGIRGGGRAITTVANQPVEPGATVLIDGEAAPDKPFTRDVRAAWVWLDGMLYVFPGETDVTITREKRTSDWSAIRSEQMHGKGDVITQEYVTLCFKHIDEADDGAGYAYMILPDTPQDQAASRAADVVDAFHLERSARFHHVIRGDHDVESIVMFEPGQVGEITANRPCMLVAKLGDWRIADPTWSNERTELMIRTSEAMVHLKDGRDMRLKHGPPVP